MSPIKNKSTAPKKVAQLKKGTFKFKNKVG